MKKFNMIDRIIAFILGITLLTIQTAFAQTVLPPDITDPVVLSADTTYDVAASDTGTISGDISGAFGITKLGDGTLVLSGNNTYTGGTILASGIIQLGSDTALGTWVDGNPATTQTGMLLVAGGTGTIQILEDRTITNHFQLGTPTDRSGSLTFDIAADKTLTISGVKNTATGGFVDNGGAINVNVSGDVSDPLNPISPLLFTGGGNLVFSNNEANNGGAVGAYFSAAGQSSVLDFRGLNSVLFSNNKASASGGGISSFSFYSSSVLLGDGVTFTGNIAGNAGDGYGGGIYSFSSSDSSSVSLGDGVTFTGNIAGNAGDGSGGGIYSFSSSDSSSVSLGDGVTFTGNIAGNAGNGSGGGIYSFSSSDSSSVSLGDGVTFTGNIAGNAGNGYGGGIYSASSSSSSSVSLGDGVTFTGNIAGNAGNGSGGGIYSYSSYSSSSSVSLGDGVTFTGNIAGNAGYGSGGGIYSYSSYSSSSSVSLGDSVTFTGNIAGNAGSGYGGGIYSASSSVKLGSHTHLTGNRVGGNNEGGQGGAVWVRSGAATLSLFGHSFFNGNLVSKDTNASLGSLGGAIYIDGAAGSKATLDASAGAIAFSGNKINVDTSVPDTFTGGDLNSIHLVKNTLLELKGNGNIYFDDPISSGTVGGNSLTKTGTGFVQFVGDSVLNPSGVAGGAVAINEGTFRIVDGAKFTTQGTNATFTTATGTTLAGAGTIQAEQGFAISGTIAPDADRFEIPTWTGDINGVRYNEFGTARTTIAADKRIGTLSLAGNTALNDATLRVDLADLDISDKIAVTGTVTGSGHVDLGNIRNGTYTVLTGTGAEGLTTSPITLNGQAITVAVGSRITGVNYVTSLADQLGVAVVADTNRVMTWTGMDATLPTTWDVNTSVNWIDSDNTPVTKFLDGDIVNFDTTNTAAGTFNITVAAPTNVASMYLSGAGSYTFNGNITADESFSTLSGSAAADGKLHIGAVATNATTIAPVPLTGTVTLNGANEFRHGTVMIGGTLVLGNDKALGTWIQGGTGANDAVNNLAFMNSQGIVVVTQGAGGGSRISVTEDRTISNHFVLGVPNAAGLTENRNGSLTFDIAADKTLTISGVKTTSDNFYLKSGGAINVNVPGDVSDPLNPISPLLFTGGGNLVFSNNEAVNGGAVGAFFDGAGQSSVLDFRGLNSVLFSNNKASASGGGIFSSSFPSSSSSSSVSLGDSVTFTGNIAGNAGSGYGGGIYSYSSSVKLGSHTHLTGNRAGGNNDGGQGGAVWVRSGAATLSLFGHSFFSGNLVSKDTVGGVGSLGGAIYIEGAAGSKATLDASAGAIAFSGNKINVDTSVPDTFTGGDLNSIHLVRNTLLELKGNGNIYFDDPISSGTVGGNSLTKTGTGFVQFVGDSVLNPSGVAGGEVIVSEGTFRVVGGANFTTQGNDATFTTATDATLAGAGTITANSFAINGTIAPDADRFEIPTWTGDINGVRYNEFGTARTTIAADKRIGTLSLTGNTALNGATLHVDLADNTNDLLNVTGALAVSGGTLNVNVINGAAIKAAGPAGKKYVIMDSDQNISGNSLSLGTVTPKFLVAYQGIDTTDQSQYVIDMLYNGNSFTMLTRNRNMWEVADTLDSGDSGLDPLVNVLLGANEFGQQQMIDQLRGTEAVADGQLMLLWQPWRAAFNKYNAQPFGVTGNGYRGQAAASSARNTWAEGFYRGLDGSGDGNARGFDVQRGGVMVGTDKNLSSRFNLGAMFSYSNPQLNSDFARIEADDYLFGLYSKARISQCFHVNSFLGYGRQSYDYRRQEIVNGVNRYRGDYDGSSLYGSLEFVRPFRGCHYTLLPAFALDYEQVWTDGFAEDGGAFNQRISDSDFGQLRTRIGLNGEFQVSRCWDLSTRAQYAYLVAGDSYATADSRFVATPNSPAMNLRSVDMGEHSVNLGTGVRRYFGTKRSSYLFADYDFDGAEHMSAHTGQLGFVARW